MQAQAGVERGGQWCGKVNVTETQGQTGLQRARVAGEGLGLICIPDGL